jgi:hypothetical protein
VGHGHVRHVLPGLIRHACDQFEDPELGQGPRCRTGCPLRRTIHRPTTRRDAAAPARSPAARRRGDRGRAVPSPRTVVVRRSPGSPAVQLPGRRGAARPSGFRVVLDRESLLRAPVPSVVLPVRWVT